MNSSSISNFFALLIALSLVVAACEEQTLQDPDEINTEAYSGTASVSQGEGTTTSSNLYDAGTRPAPVGTITSSDNQSWTVPAEVNYDNDGFPFAPDLYNPDGIQHSTADEAYSGFDPTDIVEIDPGGELVTGFLFADNYFELYVNGVAVGKDAIPFTGFNSHIVRFRVSAPYTLAMKLVDWEETVGIGTESARGFAHHAGDGGVVAVFMDEAGEIVATTGSDWKAQTFYTAPVKDLSCVSEEGTTRYSTNCDTEDADDASAFYALHWEVPNEWMNPDFDDSDWPSATTYSNETIGIDNKESYTLYIDVFDNTTEDAAFIWSTNVILDNEVIVRYTVE